MLAVFFVSLSRRGLWGEKMGPAWEWVPAKGEEQGPHLFPTKGRGRVGKAWRERWTSGEGMEREMVVPPGAEPWGLSQRDHPPLQPRPVDASLCGLSRSQAFPRVPGPHRAFLNGRPSNRAGPCSWADHQGSQTGGSILTPQPGC